MSSITDEQYRESHPLSFSDEESAYLVESIKNNKKIVMRKPDWKCHSCGKMEVRNFKYMGDLDSFSFECTCESCGQVVYT